MHFHEETLQYLNAIVTVLLEWINDIKDSYVGDMFSQQILEEPLNQPGTMGDYSCVSGLIRYKGRIFVGSGNEMRQKILTNFRSSAFGGHSEKKSYLSDN